MRLALRARRAVHPDRSLVEVSAGAAERLPLADGSADAVIAMNVIHLLDDVDEAGAELARVLRGGGRILFVEEDMDDPDHRFHHSEPHSAGGPTVDDLVRALDGVGVTPTVERRSLGGQPVTILAGRAAG